MDTFNFWFAQGIEHILSWQSLDHILYISALCIGFSVKDWKKLGILITAFTLGHSITLYLTSLDYVTINTQLVEFCIPITIAVTALLNIFSKTNSQQKLSTLYVLVLFFGFIHGMAYGANSIGSLYKGAQAVWLVLAFNVGVEIGQLVIVTTMLILSYFITLKIKKNYWQKAGSLLIFIYAIYLAIKNIP
jgi:hydrogenase/urease accessory protein HupE